MSKIMPLFASAPRIKIYMDVETALGKTTSQTLAYAVGFTIAVSVDVQPVYVVGEFAPVALEPTMVNVVTGTFQIVRLISATTRTKTIQAASKENGQSAMFKVPASVLGVLPNGTESQLSAAVQDAVDPTDQKLLFQHVDPTQLLLSKTFNIKLFMKLPQYETGTNKLKEVPWMVIRDCRITSRNTNIAMGQLVNTPLSFRGLLLTDVDSNGNAKFSSDNAFKSG